MNKASTIQTEMSSGINELIDRLRKDGVAKGEEDAAAIVRQAKAEAAAIRASAQDDAQLTRDTARKEADAFRQAGEEALSVAFRDAILTLKTELADRFRTDVDRLVSHEMKDPEFLRRIILELVGQVRPHVETDGPVEVIVPRVAIGLDELRDNLDELDKGPLTEFVRGVTGDLLRDGITLTQSDDVTAGARIYIEEDEVTVDLSAQAVSGMLSQHLQPRFRAILEGVVK
ncbi:MAG: hypothetical protein AAF950_07310 [Pseudomonadota bacterium]